MKRKTQKIVINSVIIALIALGAIWICSLFIHLGHVEYTNNAQVRQDLVPVNCRIQGYVKKIYFDDFQYVHEGDTLLVIEDAEYRLQVAQAEAALQNALAGKMVQGRSVETTRNNIAVTEASIKGIRVLMENAKNDYLRYKNLYDSEAVTKQQFDKMRTDYEALKAKYETMLRQNRGSSLATKEQAQRLSQNAAGIKVAEAALDLARLNLSYTVITAPCDGYTARKIIQEGELMQPGKLALALVNSQKIWIVANYKESQIKHIDVGSRVDIKVDAIPNSSFKGQVCAISDATGSQYSLVPTYNSAGNFVKVEGRIPVKIVFTSASDSSAMHKLHSGMNAVVEVKY